MVKFIYLFNIFIFNTTTTLTYKMIKIYAIGKVKQQFIKEGINEFLKRLTKYAKVEYIETQSLSQDKLKGFTIGLDERGEQLTSVKFSNLIKEKTLNYKQINFIIGDAFSLPKNIKYDYKLSLSKLTMPTNIARLVFIEQLYRAFTIIKNEPYHKD